MLYQYSTMAALMGGAFSGTTTIEKLLEYGNFGIGTFEGVDGEMIILDGEVYKTDSNGFSTLQPKEATSPFSNITKFSTNFKKITRTSFETLNKDISEYLNPNYFYAIKITGVFDKIDTRSPKKHEKPYPNLLEILKTQSIFNYENSKGTIVGFFSPEYTQGVGVGGFHLHYISDDRTQGGHVFNFDIKNATVEVSKPLNFKLELPQSEEYKAVSINLQTLHKEVHKAESSR